MTGPWRCDCCGGLTWLRADQVDPRRPPQCAGRSGTPFHDAVPLRQLDPALSGVLRAALALGGQEAADAVLRAR